jgi:glycosyltransferase involved in cell wall biosynthesis
MKILYVVHQFFPEHYAGTERFVLNLCKQMQKMGHSVAVLTYAITEDGIFENRDGAQITNYQFQNIPVFLVKHVIIPQQVSFDIFDLKMEKIYEKIIFENQFDIIHIGHPMRNGLILKIAQKRNIPVVLTLTDFWLFCPRGIAVKQNGQLCKGGKDANICITDCFGDFWRDRIQTRFKESRESLLIPKIVASPSQFVATMFENIFSFKVKVIRHGTEYKEIVPNNRKLHPEDTVTFGYIGTILPHKGVHLIIEALQGVPNKNVRLLIYGNHLEDREYYEKLLDLAKNDPRISFRGKYKDEEMQKIMNSLDCSLCPSTWWENSPLTILTSLAYRVPVIATNVGGSAEFIQNRFNGYNFKIGDAQSLANVFIEILNDPEKLNQIKNNIIRPRRIEEEAFEYENIYTAVTTK